MAQGLAQQLPLRVAGLTSTGVAVYGGGLGHIGFLLGGLGIAGIAAWYLCRPPALPAPPPPAPREPVLPPAPDHAYLDTAAAHDLTSGVDFAAQINALAPRAKLPVLGQADLARLAAVIDARQRKKDLFRMAPPIAVIRQPRQGIDITRAGRSWLGGLPQLSGAPWPRAAQDQPLQHLAQIALDDLPAHQLPPALPRQGSLCFFASPMPGGDLAHKVLHIPPRRQMSPDHPAPTAGAPVLARWPVAFHPLPAHDSAAAMAQAFADDKGGVPDVDIPWLWDSAQRVVRSLVLAEKDIPRTIAEARSRVADHGDRYAPELDFLIQNEPAFRRYVQAAVQWVAQRAPFTPMAPDDVALLETLFGQISTRPHRQPGFALFYRYSRGQITRLRVARRATLLTLARAEPAIYDLLPAAVKTELDAHHRLPARGQWHQMFGRPANGSDSMDAHEHDHMLLQLQADPLLDWGWGDSGVIRFWISTEDLAAQRWDAVAVTLQSP